MNVFSLNNQCLKIKDRGGVLPQIVFYFDYRKI
jgi:hypothetical protein